MRRKEYKIEDLTKTELDLLLKATMVPERSFLCFGKFFPKLYALNLVDDKYQLTIDGKTLARAWQRYEVVDGGGDEKVAG